MLNNLKIFLNLILIIVISWLLIHALALLGIFVAVAYPIWWLIAPRITPCIGCNLISNGEYCKFCHSVVNKNDIHPKNISSTLKNSLVILLISILSLGIVYGESRLLKYFGIPATPKTVSFVIPPKSNFKVGEIFPLKIEINGIKTPINAVQADLSFDPKKIQVVEISTTDSFANIFVQKEINNDTGYARLTGGLPNPGFFADHGTFGTIYLKGLQAGLVTIDFLPTSMILANDGRGSNVLKDSLGSISYLIVPEKITSDQEKLQSVYFNKQVLGAATKVNQMTFYEGDNVLGAATSSLAPSPAPVTRSKPHLFLDLLSQLNEFILNIWSKLLSIFIKA
jgi:hypothetical protein